METKSEVEMSGLLIINVVVSGYWLWLVVWVRISY